MKVSKKLAIVAGTTTLAMAGVGVGYAFFSGGGGTGSGSAGTTASVTVDNLEPSATVTGLVPGATASATSVSVTNPNTYTVQFGTIHLSLGTMPSGCTASWFSIGDDTTGTYSAGPGANADEYTGPTVQMLDAPGADQSTCLNKSIPLVVSVS